MRRKKITVLMFCVLMLISLCSCGLVERFLQEPEIVPETNVKSPLMECQTLDELNQTIGCNLVNPDPETVTNEKFLIINGDLAQYDYVEDDINFSIRASADFFNDVSGVYVDGQTAFNYEYSGEIEFVYLKDIYLARWLDVNGQYVFSGNAKGLSQEDFKIYAYRMQAVVNPVKTGDVLADYYESLVGDYVDSFSQRAVANIKLNKFGKPFITISWGNSAFEREVWKMTLNVGEDGLLYYTDCYKVIETTLKNGKINENVVSVNIKGYFSENEGKLYWNGASNVDCRECVFEKT